MRKNLFFVYILTNSTNKVLYIGVTNNLKLRVYKHKYSNGSRFTYKYKVNKLIYYEIFEDPEKAIQREKSIKNLLRVRKIELINNFNPKLNDLYNEL